MLGHQFFKWGSSFFILSKQHSNLISLLVFVCSLFYSFQCQGQVDPFIKIDRLWKDYNKTGNDSLKIEILSNISSICTNFLDNYKTADSIGDLGIRIACKNSSTILKVIAWNNYIESVDLDSGYNKARVYAKKALMLLKNSGRTDLEWRTLHNLATIFLSRRLYDSAFIESNRAMDLALKLNNKAFQVHSYLDIGMSLEGKLKKIDALNKYLPAQKLAENIKNTPLLIKCYSQLSDFYNIIKIFDKAIEYKQKHQVILLLNTHPVDSVELMWAQNQKHVIITRYNNYLLDEKSVESVIDYAIRTNNIRLKKYEFAIYRKHFIEAENMRGLYNVYNIKYPSELRFLSLNDKTLFYRLNAFFKVEEYQPDSAYYYFKLAEQRLRSDPNLLNRSNFYIRFGHFLKRAKKIEEAIENYTKAYQLAEEDSRFVKMEYMLTASMNLCELNALTGNYRQAYFYSKKCTLFSDSILSISNKEKANRMWDDYQIRLDNEKRDSQLRQRKNERNMMAGGVASFFILSLLIFRNYRNQKRLNKLLDEAKKKSEDLLLNILPYETAEELKLTGSAKAKEFDEVTVMFTDFKDFTQASERLSAEELVEKIHFYFSEFDKIIEKYGIEKIKIIGDSYMCAGGLPVNNETHAYDVVCAALEFQSFMINCRNQQGPLGDYFELRIGIHTGPVVAGIVGTKKFAYDIWGDTVNTASRMESSGEIDKVNISGSTYEKIKNQFKCTYRGKVKAKHKGEIDMYFVDSPV